MRSRFVAIILSVLLFFSTLLVVGFPEPEEPDNKVNATTAAPTTSTTQPVTEPETIICSFKDISYGDGKDQKLDLTLPIGGKKDIGLVLFIHGGGWVQGDKKSFNSAFYTIKETKDFASASMNYRLATKGGTDIDDIIDDITSALLKIKSFAAGYYVNINKVVLMGYSAGGQLALSYAYKHFAESPVTPVAVVALSAPADLTLDDFYTDNEIGDEEHMCNLMSAASGMLFTPETRYEAEERLAELSPINYVTSACVPTMIFHGRLDGVVPVEGSYDFAEKLYENSVKYDFIVFENSGHSLDKDKETKEYAIALLKERVEEWFGISKSKPTTDTTTVPSTDSLNK